MARTDTLPHFLTDVADAIREKKGTQETIQASDFDTEIENLPSGGGGLDWSAIGYSEEPQQVTDAYNQINSDYNYSKNILDNWDATQTNLASKFINNTDLKYMPLVDTSNATTMQSMFSNCNNLYSVPLLNTSNVTNMRELFNGCNDLHEVSLLNTSNATTFNRIFKGCNKLTEIPHFNTQKVETFYQAFMTCTELTTVPVLDTSVATTLQQMFSNCWKLTDTSLDNILQMCINSSETVKTLARLSLNSTVYPVSRIEALPHYQDFIDAGWTIGY